MAGRGRHRNLLAVLEIGVRGETRTRNNAALNRTRLPDCATRTYWWAVKDSNLGVYPMGYWSYNPAPSANRGATFNQTFVAWVPIRRMRNKGRVPAPLGQLPTKHEFSKIWRKAGDSNAYVPEDAGIAGQWATNYPSLPETKVVEKGITDLARYTKSARR